MEKLWDVSMVSFRWVAKTAWHTDFDNKADREAETCRTPFCGGMDMNI